MTHQLTPLFNDTVLTDTVVMILAGTLLGIGSFFYTKHAIRQRTGDAAGGFLLDHTTSWVLWAVFGAVGAGITGFFRGLSFNGLEIVLLFVILLSLSFIDNRIRKITNELIILLLILKIVALTVRQNTSELGSALTGLAAGIILFSVPSAMGIKIGWGDIKFAGAVGFYLGLIGLFQAVLIMSAVLGIFAIYLCLFRKGSLKTMAPMGPAFSLGFFATWLFPIISKSIIL